MLFEELARQRDEKLVPTAGPGNIFRCMRDDPLARSCQTFTVQREDRFADNHHLVIIFWHDKALAVTRRASTASRDYFSDNM
jgi:hypothetical protein